MTSATPARYAGKTIGIALGSGSARGLAHIGVLQALRDMGVEPGIVCGSSMGALVGACYAIDRLDDFADWVCELSTRDVLRFLGIRLLAQGGVAHAGRLIQHLRDTFGDTAIEELPKTYAAVATDLYRGREVWLQNGSVWDAVRASIAIPGMLTPIHYQHRWLVDGALVNPVPVSLCRALGADVIIAVNLNSAVIGRRHPPTAPAPIAEQVEVLQDALPEGAEAEEEGRFTLLGRLGTALRGAGRPMRRIWGSAGEVVERGPGTFEAMLGAINIMQDRITRSRLAGEPPDVMLAPRLLDIGLLDYQRGRDAIAAGRACVEQLAEPITRALDMIVAQPE
jgi:NTE family protein